MSLIKNLPLLISGTIIGIILYQSLMIAPSINKLFDPQDASQYLRYIWPKFFIIVGLLSIVSLIIIYFFNPSQKIAKILYFISLILMIISYLIIPYMNGAKDSLNETTFSILHILSILMTIAALFVNISIYSFWKY